MKCIFCGDDISADRAEIYAHCTADNCVLTWKQERRSHMAIALLPKQGFTVVYKKDAASMPATTKR